MFTFKKHIKEGPYSSFEKDCTDVKIKKKVVGHIQEIDWDCYKIMFSIKKEVSKESPADFRWVTLKVKPSTEKEAKEFLKENFEKIIKQFDLYEFEN